MIFQGNACGRVNLIGEHTDYNNGFVLPTSIPQETKCSLRLEDTGQIVFNSLHLEGRFTRTYALGSEDPQHQSSIEAITWALAQEGVSIPGATIQVNSSVPLGSGLSSSAAFSISVLRACIQAFKLDWNVEKIARIAQKLENDFLGAHVGILDPIACSLCSYGKALYLDTATLKYEEVMIPHSMALIVIHSGVTHANNALQGYNTRRQECEDACRKMHIDSLRAIDEPSSSLPSTLLKRVRHVVTENRRVHNAKKALESNDAVWLGKLFHESHTSLRDDYEVSVPEVDMLVALMEDQDGCFGARITGGGFGGSIVALVDQFQFDTASLDHILTCYTNKYDKKARILVSRNDQRLPENARFI